MATQLSLKLLVDTQSRRVLFAEAGDDVVDFLFSLLSIPMGCIISLLTKERMVGSIGNIYKSVESLDEKYIKPNQAKNVILNPTYNPHCKNAILLTGQSSTTSTVGKYYRCTINNSSTRSDRSSSSTFSFGGSSSPSFSSSSCSSYFTDTRCTRCPTCNNQMTAELIFVDPQSGKVVAEAATNTSGFVKGVVTYTVMDDLTVMPMSTISSITLLNKFNVKDISSLEELMVNFGPKEGLELLKASLQSKTVLTDVFLGVKAEPVS